MRAQPRGYNAYKQPTKGNQCDGHHDHSGDRRDLQREKDVFLTPSDNAATVQPREEFVL